MPILGVIASQISGHLTPPDTGAMFPLGMVSVGSGGSSTITFSSIPATYTHLQIRMITRAETNDDTILRFNNDSGSNYNWHRLNGDGSSAYSGFSGASVSMLYVARTPLASSTASGIFCASIIDILDYTNTNKYKTTRCLDGIDKNGSGLITLWSGAWRNTNAISTITLTPQSGNYSQYSQFALYGIKGA